jgi:predicted amidohydrolase YtcJ
MYGDKWRQDIFGEEGMRHSFPFKSMLARGLKVVSSTDFGMVPINPMVSLRACVTRLTRTGHVLGPDERLSVAEALPLLTRAPAYCAFQEHQKGSLELGKLADLVVLSEDPEEVPGPELERIQVDATVVGGQLVYERADLLAAI